MLKETVRYQDFNGNEVEKDLYFHISEIDFAEFAVSDDGKSFQDRVKAMQEAGDAQAVLKEFKEILRMAYGVRSEDGERFDRKNPETGESYFDAWEGTLSYDTLVWNFFTNQDKFAEFVNNIFPMDKVREVSERAKSAGGVPEAARARLTDRQPKKSERKTEVQPQQAIAPVEDVEPQTIDISNAEPNQQELEDFRAWQAQRNRQDPRSAQ